MSLEGAGGLRTGLGGGGEDGLEAVVKVGGMLATLQLWWWKHQGLPFEGFPGEQCLRAEPDSANKKVMGVSGKSLISLYRDLTNEKMSSTGYVVLGLERWVLYSTCIFEWG